MTSSQSSVVGACESQVLALLDWWVEKHQDAILGVLEGADPGVFGSVSLDAVGFKILEHWSGWEELFFRDVYADSFAAFTWNRYDSYWVGINTNGVRHLDGELHGRIGLVAKEAGWIDKHRRTILATQRRLRQIKKVQEA
jgi:hypothetical protein